MLLQTFSKDTSMADEITLAIRNVGEEYQNKFLLLSFGNLNVYNRFRKWFI